MSSATREAAVAGPRQIPSRNIGLFADERGVILAIPIAGLVVLAAIIGLFKGRILAAIVLVVCTAIAFPAAFLLRALLFVAGA